MINRENFAPRIFQEVRFEHSHSLNLLHKLQYSLAINCSHLKELDHVISGLGWVGGEVELFHTCLLCLSGEHVLRMSWCWDEGKVLMCSHYIYSGTTKYMWGKVG